MSGAARKNKLSRYCVTLKRDVEFTATIEVEARSAEEAEDLANGRIDADPSLWQEGATTWRSAKAKINR